MDSSISQSAAKRISVISSHLIPEETSANNQSKRNGNICPATGYDKNKVWPRLLEQDKPIRVLVTGAAGNIAYSLLFMVANGSLFGARQSVILHLLDIPAAAEALKGVHMELVDGSFPILRDVVATTDVRTAFSGVDVAILVGAFPRQKGMERKDLLKKNCSIFKEQGKALNDYASKDVKVVVVGNPANTNCAIAQANAPDLPPQNFTALTRLDHNRAKAQVALKLKVPVKSVKNIIIWGNHSATQYPDVNFGVIEDYPSKGFQSNIRSLVNDDKWVQTEFLTTVQQRGAAIIAARKLSSAASAAHAVIGHLRDWLFGTVHGEFVSMAVVSDGSYGVPKDIVFSYPVTCSQGKWSIVQNLPWDDFSKKKIDATTTELLEEKTEAFSFLG